MEEKTLNIVELMDVLKKRVRIIIICTLAFTLLASIIATFKMQPSYTATVKIFAGKTAEVQGNYSKEDLDSYSSLMKTYIQIIKTDDFMNKVIEKAELNMSAEKLMEGLSFETTGNTPILTISYKASNPEIAEKVVTTLSSEFEVGVKEVILNTYTKVIESVKVVEQPPAKLKSVIVGLVAGLLFGVLLVLVLDYLDDSVYKKEDLENLLPIPVLGALPLETNEIIEGKRNKVNKKIKLKEKI